MSDFQNKTKEEVKYEFFMRNFSTHGMLDFMSNENTGNNPEDYTRDLLNSFETMWNDLESDGE